MRELTRELIENHTVYFDAEDKNNASLYLCKPEGATEADVMSIIEAMRKAGLWSDATPKTIPDQAKNAYAEQLEYIESSNYQLAGGSVLVAACFTHEKFPYNPERWQEWKDQLNNQLQPAE